MIDRRAPSVHCLSYPWRADHNRQNPSGAEISRPKGSLTNDRGSKTYLDHVSHAEVRNAKDSRAEIEPAEDSWVSCSHP